MKCFPKWKSRFKCLHGHICHCKRKFICMMINIVFMINPTAGFCRFYGFYRFWSGRHAHVTSTVCSVSIHIFSFLHIGCVILVYDRRIDLLNKIQNLVCESLTRCAIIQSLIKIGEMNLWQLQEKKEKNQNHITIII